jgi:hypothetical protein
MPIIVGTSSTSVTLSRSIAPSTPSGVKDGITACVASEMVPP